MPKILIVDDDPLVAEFFAEVLSNTGFDIEHAKDGREAMQYLAMDSYALMIADLIMPDFEGLALISGARTLYPDLKIIAVSGEFQGEFLRPAELLGAHQALPKPLSPDVLLRAVSSLLGMD